jgi:hypothetical protein
MRIGLGRARNWGQRTTPPSSRLLEGRNWRAGERSTVAKVEADLPGAPVSEAGRDDQVEPNADDYLT